jgi:hypothetical protein
MKVLYDRDYMGYVCRNCHWADKEIVVTDQASLDEAVEQYHRWTRENAKDEE